jgi:uncharacterized protein YdbL (DUF1318 family)
MKTRSKFLLALGGSALLAVTGIAIAQESPVVAQARAAGVVGEQLDGYLGFAKSPSGDVKAAVDAINIKRRAIYTDIAAKQNATIQEVATARGCEQLATRVKAGEVYGINGSWAVKGAGAIALPAVCG